MSSLANATIRELSDEVDSIKLRMREISLSAVFKSDPELTKDANTLEKVMRKLQDKLVGSSQVSGGGGGGGSHSISFGMVGGNVAVGKPPQAHASSAPFPSQLQALNLSSTPQTSMEVLCQECGQLKLVDKSNPT